MTISNDLHRRLEVGLASGEARDEIEVLLGSTAGSIIYVDIDGDDTHDGSRGAPVATLSRAFALVSATRLIVQMGPGDFEEAATVAWPTRKYVLVKGAGSNFTTIACPVSDQTSVITVTPGVQTGTSGSFEGTIEGVTIVHEGSEAGEAQAGITLNNASMGKKLMFYINFCGFSPDEPTDRSIDLATHSDADNAVRIYIKGDGTQTEIGGVIDFTVNNLADRLHCEQVWLKGGGLGTEEVPLEVVGAIVTPNVAKEMRIRLYKCIVPNHNALSGGNGTQVVTSVCSYSWTDYADITPEVYLALDSTDLIGSHSEVIVG